jgi:hypothetical protein
MFAAKQLFVWVSKFSHIASQLDSVKLNELLQNPSISTFTIIRQTKNARVAPHAPVVGIRFTGDLAVFQ